MSTNVMSTSGSADLYRPTLNRELLALVNKPIAWSALYDLDLLPEQLDSQENMTVGLFAACNRLEGFLLAFKAMSLAASTGDKPEEQSHV